MGLKTTIEDGKGTGLQTHLYQRDGDTGLIVYTQPMLQVSPIAVPFTNATYGVEMNQNAALTGSGNRIHDGLDTVLWTGSSIQGGKYTFSSGDRAFVGSTSFKTDNAAVNDIAQFATGSLVTTGDFSALTFQINIDKDWTTDSIVIYGWNTGTGLKVGVNVELKNYFEEMVFDVWQAATIPLSDFGLGGTQQIDAIRVEQISKAGKGPKYYLDEIQLAGTPTSAPELYSVTPTIGQRMYVSSMKLYVADNIGATLADASMQSLSYDKLLGLNSLTFGMVFRRIVNGVVDFSAIIRNISDLLFVGFDLVDTISDGTNTFITFEFDFTSSSPLDSRTNDRIEIILNDDLSDLLYLRSILNVGIENIDPTTL